MGRIVPASSSAAPTTTEAPAPAAPTSEAPAPPPSSEAPPPPPASSPAPAVAAAPAPVQKAPAAGDYQSTVLYHHNIHRANHSADALSWDPTLASYAQQVAARCTFEHDTSVIFPCYFRALILTSSSHVGGGGYGQNLVSGDDEAHIGISMTDRLYNTEINQYTNLFGKDSPDMSNFLKWGHFSQMVWKASTTVGCATQACPNGMPGWPDVHSFTVCNYSPPGKHGLPFKAAKDMLICDCLGNIVGEYHNVGKSLGHPSISVDSSVNTIPA